MSFSTLSSSTGGAGSDRSSAPNPSASPGPGQQTFTVFSPTITATTTVASQGDGTPTPNSVVANATSAAAPRVTSPNGDERVGTDQSNGTGRTTVIILSTVLSVFGCVMIGVVIWACIRCRRRRSKLFNRGLTPIADDEIETWRGHRNEKGLEVNVPQNTAPSAAARPDSTGHQRQESTTSLRKPASVIVYARKSDDQSLRSPYLAKISFDGGKTSLDKDLPFSPIQARAPNAREGLTDEAIPGDDPYVSSSKHRSSRLSKIPRTPRLSHARNKSSRSSFSLHSPGEGVFGGYDSDHDIYPTHSRVSSDTPPRLSLSDKWPAGSGLSPKPLIPAEEIGRAIG